MEAEEAKRLREDALRKEQEKKDAEERAKKENEEKKKRDEEEEAERKRTAEEEERERIRKEEAVVAKKECLRREEEECLEAQRKEEEGDAHIIWEEEEQKQKGALEAGEAQLEADEADDIVETTSPLRESQCSEDGEVLDTDELPEPEPQLNGDNEKKAKEAIRIVTSFMPPASGLPRTKGRSGKKAKETFRRTFSVSSLSELPFHSSELIGGNRRRVKRGEKSHGSREATLLYELTIEKFESISDEIVQRMNKNKDSLGQVIRLVLEKATETAALSEMYALLCWKMMEQISPELQDDGYKDMESKPIAGSQLFRKYILKCCQKDFKHRWFAKEITAAPAEAELFFGLVKFIGELFKLQILTERIMHECVKKLLGNVENPKEEDIESLCQLLKTVGQLLDTPKARAHMDVYFARMKELGKSTNVSSRMQFMLQVCNES